MLHSKNAYQEHTRDNASNLSASIFLTEMNHNPVQNIWHKVKKFSKIGRDFKKFLSNFAYFYDSYCQSLIYGRETGH